MHYLHVTIEVYTKSREHEEFILGNMQTNKHTKKKKKTTFTPVTDYNDAICGNSSVQKGSQCGNAVLNTIMHWNLFILMY